MGIRVERGKDLRQALERALRHDGPALVDVRVARATFSPPVPVAARHPWAARVGESEVRDEGAGAGTGGTGEPGDLRPKRTTRERGRIPERV